MTWQILTGDCVEQMRTLDDCSIDAVVCDPPYGIGFMGHAWDQPGEHGPVSAGHGGANVSYGGGPHPAMEHGRYDLSLTANRRYQGWCEVWAAEAFRLLKPGGHLLASCGPRTVHRMASGIEDAGFEIRDTILWLYGSGFPKSLDVSKAIDKAAGAEREIIGELGGRYSRAYTTDSSLRGHGGGVVTAPTTEEAQQWDGWGTALKPAHEPIVVARKPLVGTVAANVLEHGTGGINVAGCRLEPGDGGTRDGEDTADKVYENGIGGAARFTMRPGPRGGSADGRWPANVVLSHTDDCVRVGTKQVKPSNGSGKASPKSGGFDGFEGKYSEEDMSGGFGTETVEAWECAPGCPVAALDRQSGRLQSGLIRAGTKRDGLGYHGGLGNTVANDSYGDSGGASRFYYCAKTSRAERNAGLEGFDEKPSLKVDSTSAMVRDGRRGSGMAANNHPTVKPINLMRWLVRLVTPPGGTVLDPFTGSGSTGCAAVLEGFDFIGCEREEEYVAIAEARIACWAQHVGREVEEILGLVGASEKARKLAEGVGQIGLELDVA